MNAIEALDTPRAGPRSLADVRLLALIPARGGSKGIPRKNIRELHGKPLLAWSIEAARRSASVSRVMVSTEDPEIAEVSTTWGAEVPFLRPAELARDDTPGIAPVLHALGELPEFDWVLLLQPTSPLRTAADIDGIVRFCQERSAPAAVSVCEATNHPWWVYRQDPAGRLHPFVEGVNAARRQDLPPAFVLNGALYLARRDWLLEQRSFMGEQTLGYEMPSERSIDIDTPMDWMLAELMLQRGLS